uniref:Uncharacterized protein n=1 Tax=Rhizophora mucronata TaxID=61149 RepID=A0A2P2PIX2_RHIMU
MSSNFLEIQCTMPDGLVNN